MDLFEKKVAKNFEEEFGHINVSSLMVAVSGGPDSVALLVSLCRLAHRLSIELRVAHINHALRGAESDEDQKFVEQLCNKLKVRLDVARLAPPRSKGNIEEQMRIRRYRLLYKLAGARETVIATAHHADDQAETFLLKLVRGAGLTGLSGIYPILCEKTGRVRVIRPLLSFRKIEILNYLRRREICFRKDSSNDSDEFDRNWVRRILLPQILDRLNNRAVEHIFRTATLAREAETLINHLSVSAFNEVLVNQSDQKVVLDINGLFSKPLALRRRLLRDAVLFFKPELKGLRFEAVKAMLGLLEKPNGSSIELPRGLVVVRQGDELVIEIHQRAPSFSYVISVPGKIHIKCLNRIVSVEKWHDGLKNLKPVKFGFVSDSLLVRNRHAGDVFCTQTGRSRKLKKIFNDQNIPTGQRDRLILIVWGKKIVWVEKLWAHPDYKNDKAPTIALRVRDETFKD